METGPRLVLGALGLAACAACTAPGDPPTVPATLTGAPLYVEEQRVLPDGATRAYGFGHGVALSDGTALVSVRFEDSGSTRGAVDVFVRSGPAWIRQATLVASDGVTGDNFGLSVALSGDTALVGSSGKAYVFVRAGAAWSQEATLTQSDGTAGDDFGGGVALSGDTALVGASREDVGHGNQGAVYVFVRDGVAWREQARLTAMDGAAEDNFGWAVALEGDNALVGAPQGSASRRGAAYVFVRDGASWSQQAKLAGAASGNELVEGFGWSVALSGDTALVGSPLDSYEWFNGMFNEQVTVGAAYVFVRGGASWTMQARLRARTGAPEGTLVGAAVALVGDLALVGAPGDWIGASSRQGSVTAVVRTFDVVWRWIPQETLAAGDGTEGDYFGASVALEASPVWGFLTAVGAPDRDLEGAAYFGRIADADAPCRGVPAGTTCRGSARPCDAVETCDGMDEACPPDGLAAAGTACGDPADSICDRADTCDEDGACLPNHEPPTTICRASAGDCDDAETCNGAGACRPDRAADQGDVFGAPVPCGAPGGCCGAGGGAASLWLGLVVLGVLGRRRAATALAVAALMTAAPVARAGDDLDVDSVPIVEVVETTDGSVWKGVIVELVPGASITIALSGGSVHVIPMGEVVRITREPNPRLVARAPRASPRPAANVTAPEPARPRLPAPFPTSGLRLGVALLATSSTGTWSDQSGSSLSFAPSIQLGLERVYGRLAFSGGGRLTWIYFVDDDEAKNAFWTLETHGYLRTAVHLGQLVVYAGLSVGLDTNYSYFTSVRHGYVRVGPGVTIEGGADLAITARVAFGLAGVVHPGTAAAAAPDAVPSDAVPDVSHAGVRVGTTIRF